MKRWLWSSGAFFKFSPCTLCKKKFCVYFLNLWIQKRSCLPWSSDTFWKFSLCKVYEKSSGHIITICASKNETVCRKVQTHFGSSPRPRFTEKVLDKFSRFMCPKTKLFAVKFTHILHAICLQVLRRKFWAQFHSLCVQKRSCLLCSSDAFWRFPLARLIKKVVGAFSRFMCRANKHSWLQHFVKMLWPRFIILHAHKSLLSCSGTLWST